MRRWRTLAVGALAILPACSDDSSAPAETPRYAPTAATRLSTGSPTKDEDPSVILARDGSIVVAWFSDRGGDPGDIYIARCTRGTEWSAPVRVTTSPGGDFYPNLYQDARGVFHLTWFRWVALNKGNIFYNRSTDPLVWDPANEIQVTTTADVDDWVPSIAETPDSLRVFFASKARSGTTMDIYTASMQIDSTVWGAVKPMPINSPFEHDTLPFAAWTDNQLTMVWVRHDTSGDVPWAGSPPPTSQVCFTQSSDGVAWSPEFILTSDPSPVVNVFPALFQRSSGSWRMVWLSTRTGTPKVWELPVSAFGAYPFGITENLSIPGTGYSPRVAPTPISGLYIGAWVQGPEGAQDIYYRFYEN